MGGYTSGLERKLMNSTVTLALQSVKTLSKLWPPLPRLNRLSHQSPKVTYRILDDDKVDHDVETKEQEEKEKQEIETVRVKKEFPESKEGKESEGEGEGKDEDEDEDEDEETIAKRQMRKKMSQADEQKKGSNVRMMRKGSHPLLLVHEVNQKITQL